MLDDSVVANAKTCEAEVWIALPVAATPAYSPEWVPVTIVRSATRSPSTSTPTFSCTSKRRSKKDPRRLLVVALQGSAAAPAMHVI